MLPRYNQKLYGVLFVIVLTLSSVALSKSAAAQDKIPKSALIQLTLQQTSTLCASQIFTACMAFTQERCNTMAEGAVEKCLFPLPDEIDPKLLQNSTLENCPKEHYASEGYSEEKARICFEKAMAESTGEKSEMNQTEKSPDSSND